MAHLYTEIVTVLYQELGKENKLNNTTTLPHIPCCDAIQILCYCWWRNMNFLGTCLLYLGYPRPPTLQLSFITTNCVMHTVKIYKLW